jgi:hypothetical protein
VLLPLSAGPQFANKLDQLLEQVDANQTQLCKTDHIEVRAVAQGLQQKTSLAGWLGKGGDASKLHVPALSTYTV